MIPIVAELLASGLGLLGNAVMTKGKEVIEEKLGVKIPDSGLTPELTVHLQELQLKHEDYLIEAGIKQREQELEGDKIDNANTADARGMNVRIQESDKAPLLAKLTPYYLDIGVVTAAVLLTVILIFQPIPTPNKELLYTLLGALWAQVGTIINFHRGSSARSQHKDETIAKLTQGAA